MSRPNLDFLLGRSVVQIRIDGDYGLVLSDEKDEVRVQIGRFELVTPDGTEFTFDIEADPTAFGPALGAFGATVERAHVSENGTLQLTLSGLGAITAAASENVEAWEIVGPGTSLVVCTPGGEVAVWG